MNLNEAESIISQSRSIESSFIKLVLGEFSDISFIDSFDKYDSIFRIRHDFVHWNICKYRGINFGEIPLHKIPELQSLIHQKNWNLIANQTPDIIQINGMNIKITEITVSTSRLAKREKTTKYALMIDIMKKGGFSVDLEIIVVGANMSEPGIIELVKDHGLSEDIATEIYVIVSRVSRLIHAVESTPMGQQWNLWRSKEIRHEFKLGVSDSDIYKYHYDSKFKCFNDEELKDMLKFNFYDSNINEDDKRFIDYAVEKALTIKTEFSVNDDYKKAISDLRRYHDQHSNTQKYRSFLPLPYLQGLSSDSSRRTTNDDQDLFVKFKSKLAESEDSFFMKLSQMSEHKGKISLSQAERGSIALEGPGRKHYIAQKSEEHIKRQKKNKNYWFNYQQVSYESDLDMLSQSLSGIKDWDSNNPTKNTSRGLEYLRCCQSVFRELILNSMRKDRRHTFIFKPTGINGVYILIFPGPKLRTGENLSTIWFKLFTSSECIPIDEISTHWAFKSWNHTSSFLHTDWISIDANRLDHYLRCYDRVLMAYLSYIHFEESHLGRAIETDTSNTLGIILLIYMENKRSTSKMLQDVRYLVMGALSKFRWWKSLVEKYHEPVRSPLQAYLLSKIEKFIISVGNDVKSYIESFRFGKAHQESDIISDKLAGVITLLPRVLTKGPKISFQQLLCEMYFTMLFNKNQDDPTHATFQILNKMLDGEESLQEVKNSSCLHTGGSNPISDIDILVDTPHKNQFSKYAIMIGSKLQSLDQSNKNPAGLSHIKASQNNFLNKPLSEFATYRSSAEFERSHYDDKVRLKKVEDKKQKLADSLEEKYREGGEDNEDPIEHSFPRQNRRRRCIEGIIDLLKQGFTRSFDVIQKDITTEMYYQVFKKNQIGGAREILILPIEKRITINILESFSRLICKDDEREMLTHGDIKLSTMRDIVREVRRTETTKRIVLNYNLDKTRWGPSFMPIQFIYMFKPFAHHYESLFKFLLLTLMVHTNKKCLIPEKLIQVWLKDPNDKIKHSEPNLQKLKENFLKTGELYFDNESNMGQGILHYTSSYLHLCALSFRDVIYKKLCEKQGINPGVWKDIVSSDDSYTAHALPMDSIKKINIRIELFIRAQEVTERLFNMWTSKSKSSISFLISEFNSMFGSNLTFFPTLFKFALASVMPINTDSFFRMVKESFNTSRQIVENGGSLELYMISHALNRDFCESIYHTHKEGHNNFEQFGLRRENVPYQLGVYPINDPGIMIILGPESHNYSILSRVNDLTSTELNLFKSCHNLIPIDNPELYSEMNTFDNIFTGMLRIEAATGPIKKLQRIKRQIDMKWEEMKAILEKDITIVFREPETMEEMKVITYQKLFSYGASEALRDTAASIYYARVAATVSATAFQIPYHDTLSAKYEKGEMKGHTYHTCIEYLINYKNNIDDLIQYYPHLREFNDIYELSKYRPNYNPRNPFESQNLRSLQFTEITMRIKNPIRDLIDSFWIRNDADKATSYYRDWITLKELVPVIGDSLDLTLENFQGDKTQQIKMLLLVLMRIMSYTNKPMKAVIYGQSSRTYDQSYLTLIQQNLFHNFTSTTLIMNQSIESNPRLYDKLYYYYNIFSLSIYLNCPIRMDFSKLPIEQYLRDNVITQSSKKKIMMMLMYEGLLDNYKAWTMETKTIMHYWLQRQYRDNDGSYRGNFKLLLQLGINKLILSKINNRFYIRMNETKNPMINYELLKSACDLIQIDIMDLKTKLNIGRFLILSDSIQPIMDPHGIDIILDDIPDIQIDVGKMYIAEEKEMKFLVLDDTDGYQILKTPYGLLTTDYIPFNDEFEEFFIDGISIYDLSNIRIFSSEFDYDNVDPNVMIDMINDLEVRRPKISDVTKDRLKGLISPDWETKGMTDYFDNNDEKYEDEDVMNLLMETTLTADDIKEIIHLPEIDVYDSFIDPSLNWDAINNLPTIRAKFLPQRILDRVLFCKYHFITRACIDPRLLSKSVIKSIYKQTGNMNLVYSLVYIYDKLFTLSNHPSPTLSGGNMRTRFANKFKLNEEEFNLI
jgi:hypothetical protein